MPDPYSPSSVVSDSAGSSRSGHTSPDSGASSSYSHAQDHSTCLSPVNGFGTFRETLSDEEIAQIESFYSGLYSHVHVCPTVAALYLFVDGLSSSGSPSTPDARNPPSTPKRADSLQTAGPRNPSSSSGQVQNLRSSPNRQKSKTGWSLEFSEGVPLVVHVARPDKRSVSFIFAERATGFPLWSDHNLTAASTYTCIDSDYHEFRADNLRVGLRFSAASAASRFLQQVVQLIANPATFVTPRKNQTPKKAKFTQPKKSSISPPCCFVHRTHINKDDQLTSLEEFVSPNRRNMLLQDNRASMAVSNSNKIYGTSRA